MYCVLSHGEKIFLNFFFFLSQCFKSLKASPTQQERVNICFAQWLEDSDLTWALIVRLPPHGPKAQREFHSCILQYQIFSLSFCILHTQEFKCGRHLTKCVRCCHPLSLSFSGSTSVNYFTKVINGAEQFPRVEPFANYIFYFPCICSPSLCYVKWPLAWERSNCFLSRVLINEGLLPCTLD